jgi:hypothetical protein
MWYEAFLIKRAMHPLTSLASALVPGAAIGGATAALTSREKETNKALLADILKGAIAGGGLGAVGSGALGLTGAVGGGAAGATLGSLLGKTPAQTMRTGHMGLGKIPPAVSGGLGGAILGGLAGSAVGTAAGGYAGGRLATRKSKEE